MNPSAEGVSYFWKVSVKASFVSIYIFYIIMSLHKEQKWVKIK